MAARFPFAVRSLASSTIFWRGYAAAASNGVVSAGFGRGGSTGTLVGKVEERGGNRDAEETNAWAPDPVTGYYRPANRAAEIDPAELREILLKQRQTVLSS